MRYLLPTVAIAAMTAFGAGVAEAKDPQPPSKRVSSHLSLHLSQHAVMSGERLVVHGAVRPGGKRRVKVVISGPDGAVATATTSSGGAFALRFAPSQIGTYSARAYVSHRRRLKASQSATRHFTAFNSAVASYYGPGLYGGALACGGTLQPGTLGVAHKTLPCGSRVKLRYGRRSVTVRVVDRGPYAAGRDFDLTEATKARLGFPDLGVVLFSRGG